MRNHQQFQKPISNNLPITLALVNQLLIGINVKYLGCELDVGLDSDVAGEKLLEDRRVSSDEFYGANGDLEGVFLLGDDCDWQGFGRL